MKWFCYILRSTDKSNKISTYSGSTNNLEKNIINIIKIKKVSKATHGKQWEFYAIMTGYVSPSKYIAM